MKSGPKVHYFDSSVVLRYAINHASAVRRLVDYSQDAFTSAVTRIECLRVIDRWRIKKEVSDEQLVAARSLCLQILDGLSTIALDRAIVAYASQSFPIALKSLDAIHLASAMQLQAHMGRQVAVLTHDVKLGFALTAMNLEAVGL